MKDITTFIGVDLAWISDKNHSGLVVLQGDEIGSEIIAYSDGIATRADVLAYILQYSTPNTVVAIDAPLIIKNQTGQRPCDRLVSSKFGARHAAAHSANLNLYPHAGSVALTQELIQNGFTHGLNPASDKRRIGKWFFEVYPHPAHVVLFDLPQIIKYKKGKVADRRQGLLTFRSLLQKNLTQADPRLIPTDLFVQLMQQNISQLQGRALKHYEDILDSLLCAYLALFYWRWGNEKNELIGDMVTGYIINPTVTIGDGKIDSIQMPERVEMSKSKPSKRKTTRSRKNRKFNPGNTNKNKQYYLRDTGQPGTDNMQYVIVVRCLECSQEYGTNGSNFFQCKCPRCQGGKSSIAFGCVSFP